MLNLNFIKDNPEEFQREMGRRGIAPVLVQEIIGLLSKRSLLISKQQSLQEERNRIATEIGKAKKAKSDAQELINSGNAIKTSLTKLEVEVSEILTLLHSKLEILPNILAAQVPEGKDAKDNKEVKRSDLMPKEFTYPPKSHEELGANLCLLDFANAAKISGARFAILKGQLARLERALSSFMLDIHTNEFGYEEVSPPLLVKEEALWGVGQLPKFRDDLFATTTGEFLISTGEVPLTSMLGGCIVEEKQLPLRYTALTPCFRSEAGSAGQDTKGLIRMHQFYKVELVSFVTETQGEQEHERMLGAAEEVLKRLDLPYRVMLLCSGDTGFSSSKTYDIEVWLPSQKRYREISSCSYFSSFQGRRLKCRYKAEGQGNKTLHTLNGSGLAVGRTLLAILENHQNADGSISIPVALQPYTGFAMIK